MLGRIIGTILGIIAFKHIIGAILGFIAGYYFDKSVRNVIKTNEQQGDGLSEKIRPLFMQLLFTSLGHLAKSDGRVSEEEIAITEKIIERFGLDAAGREQAIAWFQQGAKQENHYDDLLKNFAHLARTRFELKKTLLEMLVSLAMADGELHQKEEDILLHVATTLGIPAFIFKQILASLKAQTEFHQNETRQNSKDQLASAYDVLGVAASDTDADIKKAYRKLMSEHHPDKLIAQGVPEAVVKEATERSQTIQAAYDLVKSSRKKAQAS